MINSEAAENRRERQQRLYRPDPEFCAGGNGLPPPAVRCAARHGNYFLRSQLRRLVAGDTHISMKGAPTARRHLKSLRCATATCAHLP